MRPQPTAAQVRTAGLRLGFHIDPEDLPVFRDRVGDQLGIFHDFLTERFESTPPTVVGGDRSGGHRPDHAEDPHGAWAWRCSIRGAADGVLAGRTVSFKDHISVAGIPQTYNTVQLDGFVADLDATVVTRVLDAGGTVVGKNVLDGLAFDYPKPTHPSNAKVPVGGSSSGSAAAVAAGEVDISIGGDQGGSVRIPAAYCGILGLKPTFGLVSHFGATFCFEQSLDHLGPIARSSVDIARAMEAISGHDGLDPRQGRNIPHRYEALSTLDDGIVGVRVGVLEEGLDEPVDPHIRDGFLAALDVLASRGAVISTVSVPLHRRQDAPYAALAVEGSRAAFDYAPFGMSSATHYPQSATVALNQGIRDRADLLPPRIKVNHIAADIARQLYSGAVYAKAQNVRGAFVRAYDAALSDVDVLAMPTVRSVPTVAAKGASGDRATRLAEDLDGTNWMFTDVARNTKPFNYTGHPALALPCGKSPGVPVSMELVGRHLEDALLLRVAAAYGI